MTAKLNTESSDALHAAGDSSLEVVDPTTNRVYVIIDSETHREAMEALQRQRDIESLQRGIDQAEAGDGIPLEEADRRLRAQFGFSSRQSQ